MSPISRAPPRRQSKKQGKQRNRDEKRVDGEEAGKEEVEAEQKFSFSVKIWWKQRAATELQLAKQRARNASQSVVLFAAKKKERRRS